MDRLRFITPMIRPYLPVLACLAGTLLPQFAHAQASIPPGVRSYLQSRAGLSGDEMNAVASGQGVAKLMPTKQDDEMAVTGAIYLNVAPLYLASAYAQVDKIEPVAALQHGVFSTPAKVSDLAGLTLEADDIKDLRKCKPGDCGMLLPDAAIARFQKEINWNSGSATDDANRLFRQILVDYVNAYRAEGDKAVANFQTGRKQQSATGVASLLAEMPSIAHHFPQLEAHLQNYPRGGSAETKDYILWVKTDTGLKPTIRMAHLIVHTETLAGKKAPVFAIKSLYASHYLLDSLALRVLVPTTEGDAKSCYLVVLARGHLEGMTGIKGKIIRSTILNSMQKETAGYLDQMKQVVEAWNRQYGGK
jgi:hypothetical protein